MNPLFFLGRVTAGQTVAPEAPPKLAPGLAWKLPPEVLEEPEKKQRRIRLVVRANFKGTRARARLEVSSSAKVRGRMSGTRAIAVLTVVRPPAISMSCKPRCAGTRARVAVEVGVPADPDLAYALGLDAFAEDFR